MATTKYPRYKDRIEGKIIIQALLKNTSPLLIGKGAGESADAEVMRMPAPDNRPYIPASSMAGVLKHFMLSTHISTDENHIWGRADRPGVLPLQSHFLLDDLVVQEYSPDDIVMRDGVRINHQTGTAEDKKKYDYQLVEPGLVFPFRAEITLRASMDKAARAQMLDFPTWLQAVLNTPHFRIGANTNTGFGKLSCSDFQAFHFQFPDHADHWFEYVGNKGVSLPEELKMSLSQNSISQSGSFQISAKFGLKSSLIIGAYGIDGSQPDKSHLKSRESYVLPGKSIRGALRHRAVKILNTLGEAEAVAVQQIRDLFGDVKEDSDKPFQQKGRLRIEESVFEENAVVPMEQDRIRIDRFTGGTIKGALFSSEAVWKNGAETAVSICLTILKKAKPSEKRLLMLILKDLWLEDLAIGGEKNIGRGILTGLEATISSEGEIVSAFKRKGEGAELQFEPGYSASSLIDLITTKTA